MTWIRIRYLSLSLSPEIYRKCNENFQRVYIETLASFCNGELNDIHFSINYFEGILTCNLRNSIFLFYFWKNTLPSTNESL